MAILNAGELRDVRNICSTKNGTVTVWTKPQINAGAQAIEDFLTTNQAAISAAVDAATSPVTLSNAVKKVLFAAVVYAKYLRDK